MSSPSDEEKIAFFNQQGITKLPHGYRNQILTITQAFPKKFYSPEILAEGLGMSVSYAYKICEQLCMHRILEKTKEGKTCYYRFKEGGNGQA